jgi:rSAM/selenodomain-associated transferase 2
MINSRGAVSIIIPVLNETGIINEEIRHLLEMRSSLMREIIVVDGDSHGNTIKTITNKDVTTAISEQGRARQMNLGAARASGEVLLFLHVDTLLPGDAFARVIAALADDRSVAGAFELGVASEKRVFRITEKYVALRTRVTRVPFGDQAIFIRKDYFERIGGYKEVPLMEDVELMKRIKKRGDGIVIIPERVMTSARRWGKNGILFCTLRNWALQLSYALGVPPERLARWYK